MKVYLDVCCLCRPFDDQTQSRIRLESEAVLATLDECLGGGLTWISSDAIEEEVLHDPEANRKGRVLRILKFAAERVAMSPQVRTLALEFHARGLQPIDSLHLASAEIAGCDVLLTTDDSFQRIANRIEPRSGVRVENPLRWWMERQP